MFSARSKHYFPLRNDSPLSHGDCEISSKDSVLSDAAAAPFDSKQRKARAIPWALLVIIVCTLVNVTLTVFPRALVPIKRVEQSPRITRQDIHQLRRPNQYIGLDEIPRPSPPVERQLTTYPILLSLVDAAAPDSVFDDDFAARMVHSGTITPDDRRVRVTPTVSTIIQFRAIDWGMEICELHVELPESYGQEGHSGSLAIYRVNATIPLDGGSLSYSSRPSRIAKLGQVQLGNGAVTWHRKFSCATDDVLSFELGCLPLSQSGGDPKCLVEWIQIKNALPAIYMIQHATR